MHLEEIRNKIDLKPLLGGPGKPGSSEWTNSDLGEYETDPEGAPYKR